MNAIAKMPFKKAALASLLAAGMVGLSAPATAHEPDIELLTFNGIGGPNPTIFVGSFPTTISVAMSVVHEETRHLNVLDLQVDGVSVLNNGAPIGNPFQGPGNTNACPTTLPVGMTSCNVTGTSNAAATLSLPLEESGQYSITLSVKHRSDSDEDSETISVALLNVEYPAPPAVANAYINSQPSAIRKLFSSKVRGCVISMIAENHAKDSRYGPKGGPYDENLIKADTSFYSTSCGGPAL